MLTYAYTYSYTIPKKCWGGIIWITEQIGVLILLLTNETINEIMSSQHCSMCYGNRYIYHYISCFHQCVCMCVSSVLHSHPEIIIHSSCDVIHFEYVYMSSFISYHTFLLNYHSLPFTSLSLYYFYLCYRQQSRTNDWNTIQREITISYHIRIFLLNTHLFFDVFISVHTIKQKW